MRHICILVCLISSTTFATPNNPDEDIRWRCLGKQVAELATNPILITDVNNYNTSPPDPHKIDRVWPKLRESDSVLNAIIANPSADAMRKWIANISIQGEGLLIGRNGGLVAATEKTTDFWQGDEAQFLRAINLKQGEAYFQSETLDESTHLMLVKVSTPIYNPRAKHAIGVLVIGFDQFVIDFSQPCKDEAGL